MEWHSSRVVWNGTVHEMVETTVHEVDLQASKSGQFPVTDIKGLGTAQRRLEDFWRLYEFDCNCRKQSAASPDYVNPTAVRESSE